MQKFNLHNPQQDSMKAFIIYKDFASAVKANAVLQYAAKAPDVHMQWDIRSWRMDRLKFAHVAEKALADAADAHLILFAGDFDQSVPFWLQNWLELWAKCRQTRDAALAVILGRNTDAFSQPLTQELSCFARRKGLSFIVGERTAIESVENISGESLPERKLLMSAAQPGFIIDTSRQDSYRGWGIND